LTKSNATPTANKMAITRATHNEYTVEGQLIMFFKKCEHNDADIEVFTPASVISG